MGKPAARISDMHTCPMVTGVVPHVGGPVLMGCPTVIVGGMPQARITDTCTCVGPPDMIAMGSATVMVGGLNAARMGDPTVHGGVIAVGCPTVLIGDAAGGGGGAGSGGASGDDTVTAMLTSGLGLPSPATQAATLIAAAKNGTPFCERCARGG